MLSPERLGCLVPLYDVYDIIVKLRAPILLHCILFKKFQPRCSFCFPSCVPSSPWLEGTRVGGGLCEWRPLELCSPHPWRGCMLRRQRENQALWTKKWLLYFSLPLLSSVLSKTFIRKEFVIISTGAWVTWRRMSCFSVIMRRHSTWRGLRSVFSCLKKF